MEEIYISTDIEADGPIPGPHSMYSLASAAFLRDGTIIDTFSVNLEELEGATGHPETMKWWATEPAALAICRKDQRAIAESMTDYALWLESLPGKPILVGYPVTFDFMFVYWYLIRFVGRCPFSYNGIDVKTYALAMLKADGYQSVSKSNLSERWIPQSPHTHVALDDAIEQGRLFCSMFRENTA
jgi:hypothetical protein